MLFKTTGTTGPQVQLEIAEVYTFPAQERGLFAFLLAAVLTNALGPGARVRFHFHRGLLGSLDHFALSFSWCTRKILAGTQLTTFIFSPQRHRQQCRGPEAMLGDLASLNPTLVAADCDSKCIVDNIYISFCQYLVVPGVEYRCLLFQKAVRCSKSSFDYT
jgi:hypothetical protein